MFDLFIPKRSPINPISIFFRNFSVKSKNKIKHLNYSNLHTIKRSENLKIEKHSTIYARYFTKIH